MSSMILQAEELQVCKGERTILQVPQLQIVAGEIVGVVGPNGAGKSTLIKALALLDPPTTGRILLDNRQVWPGQVSLAERRELALVFQQPLMLDGTVAQNVGLPLKMRHISRKEREDQVQYWLEQFGVAHLAMRHARTLSGGEAQRVSLARAMVYQPKLLFLDEPFSALDLPTRRSILRDFQRILKETKTTTLFISHDYAEIQYLCDSMVLLYHGTCWGKESVHSPIHDQLPEAFSSFLKDWMTPLVATSRE